MKFDTTPAPRRRQPILLERLEGRLLFDAAQLAPSVDATQPAASPLVSDVAQAMDLADGSQDAALQAAAAVDHVTDSEDRILAFPGAAGMGAYAQGGRGGDVFHVTSLDDYGTGTLREGVNSATGPRTIVFDVSGTIELSSWLAVDSPYLTIAGQTAPGDGITLQTHGLAILNTHDIIVRYMRFRPGDTVRHEEDALLVYSSHDVMIDHVSASWAVDETIDTSKSDNVTIQWSIIGEGLNDSWHRRGPHSMGSIHTGGGISFHHNLFTSNNMRSPLMTQQADVVNNVMYNWGTHGTIVGWSAPTQDPFGITQVNLQANYYVAGPSTTYEYSSLPYLGHVGSELWQSNNLLDANRNGTIDGEPLTAFLGSSVMVDSRFDYPLVPIDDPLTAYNRVLDDAGASLSRDAVDQRLVNNVISETGSIIDSQDEVGGWPILQSNAAPRDSDGDGMPDAWEDSLSHLDSLDVNDGNGDANGDGLTHLEDYLAVVAAGDPSLGITGPKSIELGDRAVFTWSATNPLFDPSATHTFEVDWDGDGQVDQRWDGQLGAPVEHVFDRAGPHEVIVAWRGPTGQTSQAVHRVDVTELPAAPEIDLRGPRQVEAGATAIFTVAAVSGSSDDTQSYVFDIDWDNDDRADQRLDGPMGSSVEHEFEAPGVYTVTATLTDTDGRQTTSTHEVEVTAPAPAPEIDLRGPRQVEAGATAIFTVAAVIGSSDDTQSYVFDIDWDNDGRADQRLEGPLGSSVEHEFEAPGVYAVTAALTDADGRQTMSTHEVEVTAPAAAPEIDLRGPRQVEAGATAIFTVAAVSGSSGDTQSYVFDIDWDNDDRADQRLDGPLGSSVEHEFEAPGVYTVTATLTDTDGRQTTSTHEVEVTAPAPAPEIDLRGPRQVEAGATAIFTVAAVSGSSDDTQSYVFDIDWDNDDRADQRLDGRLGSSVEHEFEAPGVYTVTATLTDTDGRQTTSTHEVEVTAPAPAPEIDLQGPRRVEAGVSETFTVAAAEGASTDAQSYTFDIDWDGNGNVDEQVQGPLGTRAQHTFEQPGTYVVEAVLTDSRGRHTTSTHVVEVTAPLPAPEIEILAPRQVLIEKPAIFTIVAAHGASDSSQPYTFDIDWNGDGKVDQRIQGPLGLDLEHTFEEPGTYVVEAVLTDARGRHTTSTSVVDVTFPRPAVDPAVDDPTAAESDVTSQHAIQVDGPRVLEAGEVSAFTLTATDPSLNHEQTYLFAVDWNGDGKIDQVIEGHLGTRIEHAFENWGKYSVRVSLLGQQGIERASGGTQVLVTEGLPDHIDRVLTTEMPNPKSPLAKVLETDGSNGSTYELSAQRTGPTATSDAAEGENTVSDTMASRAAQDVDWQVTSEILDEPTSLPSDNRLGPQGAIYNALEVVSHEANHAAHAALDDRLSVQVSADTSKPASRSRDHVDGPWGIAGEELLIVSDVEQTDLIWALTSVDATSESTNSASDGELTVVEEASDDNEVESGNENQQSAETRPRVDADTLSRDTRLGSSRDGASSESQT